MSLADRFIMLVAGRRPPDFIIGGADHPYLRRWGVTPWSGLYRSDNGASDCWWKGIVRRLPGIYLHEFLRDDDDRAHHDHPWANASILLRGQYLEHTIAAGGVHHVKLISAPALRVRWTGRMAHRIALVDGAPCWSLFITGWRYRDWGFHCPRGWVFWKDFVRTDDTGAVGKGCDQ